MAFILFIFLIAAAISAVAAYFSLVGLGALFAATFWGVVVMAGTLEVGKIVATKWVHANWRNPNAPWYFRGLFCVFIAALMTITSLGIYGYLSKGHLEQSAPVAGLDIQVAQLDTQIKQKQAENDQLQKRLDQISRITDKSLESSGRAGLRAANQQKKESAGIQTRIDENNKVINDLNGKLIPLKTQGAEVEAKLGPVKYVAELFGWEPESAVRIIIVVIMIAFDPLALSLFIAGSISLNDRRAARRKEEETESVLPVEELVVPMPPVEEPKPVEVVPDQAETPEEPKFTQETIDHFKDQLEAKMEADLEKMQAERLVALREMEDEVAAMRDEQEKRLAELDALHEAVEHERREFNEEMEQTKHLLAEVADLDETKKLIASDHEALTNAHRELLDMEARLNDERELLQQWQDQVTEQQNAINAWSPTDERTDKEKILEMLERNPQVVNEIISTVDAMRHVIKPGL